MIVKSKLKLRLGNYWLLKTRALKLPLKLIILSDFKKISLEEGHVWGMGSLSHPLLYGIDYDNSC